MKSQAQAPSVDRLNAVNQLVRGSFEHITEETIQRFQSRIQKTDGCWLWTGHIATTGGGRYGNFIITLAVNTQAQFRPSRFAWMAANGRPIPEGMSVCHACDVPNCVNPAHLFIGTHQENMQDAAQKGRLSHPRVKKLTFEQREEIRRLRAHGVSLRKLAVQFGVSKPSIQFHLGLVK